MSKALQTSREDDHWAALELLAGLIDHEIGNALDIHFDGVVWTVRITMPNGTEYRADASALSEAMEQAAQVWSQSG